MVFCNDFESSKPSMMFFCFVSFFVFLILQPLVYRLVGFLSFSSPQAGLRHGVKTRRLKKTTLSEKHQLTIWHFPKTNVLPEAKMALFWARLKGQGPFTKEVPLVLVFFFIFKHSSLIQNLLGGHVVDCSPAWFQDLFLFSHRWTQQSADEAKAGVRVTGLLPKLHFTILDLSVQEQVFHKQTITNNLPADTVICWIKRKTSNDSNRGRMLFQGDYFFLRFYVRLGYFTDILWKKRLSLYSISPVRYVATCLPKTSDLGWFTCSFADAYPYTSHIREMDSCKLPLLTPWLEIGEQQGTMTHVLSSMFLLQS